MQVRLRDGREMLIRPAETRDASAIAQEHELPREGAAPASLYRNYFLAKTLIYVRAPGACVLSGWVGEELAGFIFHCTSMEAVRRFTKSPRTLAWLLGQALRGRFGFNPRLWIDLLRWGVQHFRQPARYAGKQLSCETMPEVAAWIGTVHTVARFRRLGVATHLLDATERTVAAAQEPQIALWVAEDNSGARELYSRLGYECHGSFARVGEECRLMVKQLSNLSEDAQSSE